jgi:hypothetical protein
MAELPPTLFLVVDAIPWDLAQEVWREGGMPGFAEPRAVASVFPALTHVAVAALLEGTFHQRPFGYEVRYLHAPSGEIRGGFDEPGAEAAIEPFRVRPEGTLGHGSIYFLPRAVAAGQIRWISYRYQEEHGPWLGYLWATDAVGHFGGREGMKASFADVCAQVDAARRARLSREGVLPDVVLCSDHGMAFGRNMHLPAEALEAHLRVFGFDPEAEGSDRVRLVPFGDVSAGAAWCDPARADEVAELVATADGVELACAVLPEGFRAWRRRHGLEHARIRRDGTRWRYQPGHGDPLDLAPVFRRFADPDGALDDHALLAATAHHPFPDALHRVHRGLTSLVEYPAHVLFSMAEGWTYGPTIVHAGAELMGGQVGTHGALSRASSLGFCATTAERPGWPEGLLRPENVFAPWRDLVRAGSTRASGV